MEAEGVEDVVEEEVEDVALDLWQEEEEALLLRPPP